MVVVWFDYDLFLGHSQLKVVWVLLAFVEICSYRKV